MSYGDLSPEGRQMAEAELAAKTAKLEAEIAACPYCKAAKTRAAGRVVKLERQVREALPNLNSDATAKAARAAVSLARPAECKRHRERRRLNYVTSPLSETYWAS